MGRSDQPPQCAVIFHSSAVETRGKRGQGTASLNASASASSSSSWKADRSPRCRSMGSFQVLAKVHSPGPCPCRSQERPAAQSALDRHGSPTNPLDPGTQASTARVLPYRALEGLYSNDSYGRQKLFNALACRTHMPEPLPSGTQ